MSCVRCVITSLHDMTLHHSCDHHDDIFRPEKECPELPDPDNGQVHLTGRNFQVSGIVTFLTSIIIVTVQDRAVYTCDGGYRLVGVEKVRVCLIIIMMVITEIITQVVCQTSGQWSGAMPQCVRAQGESPDGCFSYLDKCLDYCGVAASPSAEKF